MSCPQVPERFGELGPRILESVPCGPFLYPGASLPCSAPTYFLHIFMHGATDGPLLMDNLEPPPTHRVPAPLLGSCPPGLSSLLSTVTSPARAAHTGSQLERPPLFFYGSGGRREYGCTVAGAWLQDVTAELSTRLRRAQPGPPNGGLPQDGYASRAALTPSSL